MGNAGNNKLRNQVEQELQATIERLAEINLQLDYYKQRAFDPPSFGNHHASKHSLWHLQIKGHKKLTCNIGPTLGYVPEHVLKESQQSFPVTTGRSHSNSFSTSDYADNEDGT